MPRMDSVTLKQLRALKAVAESGSLAGAGRALGLTTPTIHSQIKNLEVALAGAVFDRSKGDGSLHLSTEGQEMLRAAQRIEEHLSQAIAAIRTRHEGKAGRVRIAVVSTGKYFAPRLVRRLGEIFPDIDVSLRVANRAETLEGMERSAFDLIIMGRPPRQQMANAVPIGAHPHCVVVPPDHPMADQPVFDPEELLSNTFIHREHGSGTRVLAERFLERLGGEPPQRILEMDSNETIKQAVMAGLGISILSRHTIAMELNVGNLATVQGVGLPVMRQWYLVQPDGAATSSVAQTISSAIKDLNGSFLPE